MVSYLFDNYNAISFINPVNYVKSRRGDCKGIDTYLSDGIFSCLVFSIFSGKFIKRFSFDFTSLAGPFFTYCVQNNLKVYLVGAKADEIRNFREFISKEYIGIKICGISDGYLKDDNKKQSVLTDIATTGADVVICGMGCPLQEEFISEVNVVCTNIKITITCGGFFHQFQHSKKYYPTWVNKLKLRMPYRFYKEPHTRSRLIYYPLFFFFSLYDFIILRFKGVL